MIWKRSIINLRCLPDNLSKNSSSTLVTKKKKNVETYGERYFEKNLQVPTVGSLREFINHWCETGLMKTHVKYQQP